MSEPRDLTDAELEAACERLRKSQEARQLAQAAELNKPFYEKLPAHRSGAVGLADAFARCPHPMPAPERHAAEEPLGLPGRSAQERKRIRAVQKLGAQIVRGKIKRSPGETVAE